MTAATLDRSYIGIQTNRESNSFDEITVAQKVLAPFRIFSDLDEVSFAQIFNVFRRKNAQYSPFREGILEFFKAVETGIVTDKKAESLKRIELIGGSGALTKILQTLQQIIEQSKSGLLECIKEKISDWKFEIENMENEDFYYFESSFSEEACGRTPQELAFRRRLHPALICILSAFQMDQPISGRHYVDPVPHGIDVSLKQNPRIDFVNWLEENYLNQIVQILGNPKKSYIQKINFQCVYQGIKMVEDVLLNSAVDEDTAMTIQMLVIDRIRTDLGITFSEEEVSYKSKKENFAEKNSDTMPAEEAKEVEILPVATEPDAAKPDITKVVNEREANIPDQLENISNVSAIEHFTNITEEILGESVAGEYSKKGVRQIAAVAEMVTAIQSEIKDSSALEALHKVIQTICSTLQDGFGNSLSSLNIGCEEALYELQDYTKRFSETARIEKVFEKNMKNLPNEAKSALETLKLYQISSFQFANESLQLVMSQLMNFQEGIQSVLEIVNALRMLERQQKASYAHAS